MASNRLAEKLMILRERGNGLLIRMYKMKRDFNTDVDGNNAEAVTLTQLLNDTKSLSTFTKNVLTTKKFSQLAGNAFSSGKLVDDLVRVKQVCHDFISLCQTIQATSCKRHISQKMIKRLPPK